MKKKIYIFGNVAFYTFKCYKKKRKNKKTTLYCIECFCFGGSQEIRPKKSLLSFSPISPFFSFFSFNISVSLKKRKCLIFFHGHLVPWFCISLFLLFTSRSNGLQHVAKQVLIGLTFISSIRNSKIQLSCIIQSPNTILYQIENLT